MASQDVGALHVRLREARESAGLSQGQVAKKLDFHRPTISEIEAGRRRVTAEELGEFAKLYGVSAEWLMRGSDGDVGSNAKLRIAARELSKMSDTDLDRLMRMIRMIRKGD